MPPEKHCSLQSEIITISVTRKIILDQNQYKVQLVAKWIVYEYEKVVSKQSRSDLKIS